MFFFIMTGGKNIRQQLKRSFFFGKKKKKKTEWVVLRSDPVIPIWYYLKLLFQVLRPDGPREFFNATLRRHVLMTKFLSFISKSGESHHCNSSSHTYVKSDRGQ